MYCYLSLCYRDKARVFESADIYHYAGLKPSTELINLLVSECNAAIGPVVLMMNVFVASADAVYSDVTA
jgi:hypothetical protein